MKGKVIIIENCLLLVYFLPCIIVLKDAYITVSKQLHLPFETTRLTGCFVKLRPIYKFRADNLQFPLIKCFVTNLYPVNFFLKLASLHKRSLAALRHIFKDDYILKISKQMHLPFKTTVKSR